jgi:hypothetical protein
MIKFVSGGPKNYAYLTAQGNSVVKVKGFSLNSTNIKGFTFDSIKGVVLGGYTEGDADEGWWLDPEAEHPRAEKVVVLKDELRESLMKKHNEAGVDKHSVVVDEHGISVYNPTRLTRTCKYEIVNKPEQKIYTCGFDKRIVLSDFTTLPYGFIAAEAC